MPNRQLTVFQNEKEEQLEVNMWLKYQWMDENLKWDPEQYENGLSSIDPVETSLPESNFQVWRDHDTAMQTDYEQSRGG